jgi:hypothetical protein
MKELISLLKKARTSVKMAISIATVRPNSVVVEGVVGERHG